MLAVELRPEERRSSLQDLVRAPKLPVLLLELPYPARLARAQPVDVSIIYVGLLDPHSDGLEPVSELRRDSLHRPMLSPQLRPQRPHRPDR